MRHIGAGLAIPDFPLMFGHVLPTHWDPKIAVHFAHRAGALIVALAIMATSARVVFHHDGRPELTRPTWFLVILMIIQATLRALPVLSRHDGGLNSTQVDS